MNALTKTETRALQAPQQQNANALALNADSLDSMMRVAELMASGRSTVPAHLQKSPADCLAVVMQALQWGLNPFVVAQKTHVVNGHLGYEGQLVNAVVQTSGSIDGRFHYEFKGSAGSFECRVGATIRGEGEITWGEWLSEAKVTTKNSPLWKTNPKQQLGYLQVKNWARLYCPGAILGVYSPDEFEAPQQQPRDMGAAQLVQERPQQAPQPTLTPELMDKAECAAQAGVAAYSEFWKNAGVEARKLLRNEHGRLKDVASAADAQRTVDDTREDPFFTFEDVLAAMCAAKTLDELYAATGKGSGPTNAEEAAMLEGKFEEMKQKLEAVA